MTVEAGIDRVNFNDGLILFIEPQLKRLTGGVSELDGGADIFGWHLE